MEILFLSNRPAKNTEAATVTEYLDALVKYSQNSVYEISMLHHFPAKIDLDRFDVVLTHYSLSLGPLMGHYLGDDLVTRLKRFKGLKAAFLQDEYRAVQTYWKHLNELGIDVLFSCVPESEIPKVYPERQVPNLRVVNVLTGYVPETLLNLPVRPIAQRSIDVGYRTRQVPFWLGRLGREKTYISEEFARRAKGTNLILDVSTKEGERLYGTAWTKFVSSCRSVIGVESGASIIDFDGKLEQRVNEFVAANSTASFEEVYQKFLTPFEGTLNLHQISPRCFEAAALRTPMVLFEGLYSNLLEPGSHFIVLKKDFSNFDEVLTKLRDHEGLQNLAERTYQEVALNPELTYRNFISKVDRVLAEELVKRSKGDVRAPYSVREFDKAVSMSLNYSIRRDVALNLQSILLGIPIARRTLFGIWHLLPRSVQNVIRPLTRIISR